MRRRRRRDHWEESLLRIGVMLRTIDERQGIGVYTQNLMDHLLALDTPHEFVLFYKNADYVGRYARFDHVTEQVVAARTKPQWDQFAVLGAAKRASVDLLFNTKFTVPVFSPIKSAMVLHGSEWWVYPKAYRLADRINIRIMMPWYCRKASRLIANSEMTKRDFVNILGVDPGKIATVYFGADEKFTRITDEARLHEVREKYDLPERFILNVARLYPGKNFPGLLHAFAELRGEVPHKLAVAGVPRHGRAPEYDLIEELGLTDSVHFPGWIPQEDLVGVYNLADAFVFPSFYESFGLVLLEAMGCGCPIVASNTGALPEIAGDAARFVDPRDPSDIAAGLREVLTDEALRDRLVANGTRRVAQFSWERCARQTLDALESIATNGA